MSGMLILKQLAEADKDYVPTVFIYYYEFEHPIIGIDLRLPQMPVEADFDHLRLALKKWAKDCGFGKLAQEER